MLNEFEGSIQIKFQQQETGPIVSIVAEGGVNFQLDGG